MPLKAMKLTLVKEHSFKFTVGSETHLFLVEELVAKLSSWPERFRLRLGRFLPLRGQNVLRGKLLSSCGKGRGLSNPRL